MDRIHLEFTKSPNSVQPITKLIHLDLVLKSISSSKPNQPTTKSTLPRLTLGLRCTEKRLVGLNRVPYLTVFFYIVNLRVPKRNMFDWKDHEYCLCIYINYIYIVYFLFIHSVYLSIITCLFSSISIRYLYKGIKLLRNVQIQHYKSVCVHTYWVFLCLLFSSIWKAHVPKLQVLKPF